MFDKISLRLQEKFINVNKHNDARLTGKNMHGKALFSKGDELTNAFLFIRF